MIVILCINFYYWVSAGSLLYAKLNNSQSQFKTRFYLTLSLHLSVYKICIGNSSTYVRRYQVVLNA